MKWQISSHEYDLSFFIEKQAIHEQSVRYIVGRNGNCVDLLFDSLQPDELQLYGLSYHTDCLANRYPMVRKIDIVNLIKCSILFAIQDLNQTNIVITNVSISDTATFNGMPLGAYDLLVYGQTWYERKFNTVAYPEEKRMVLEQIKQRIHSPIHISQEMFLALFRTEEDKQKALVHFTNHHTTSLTWQELFYLYHTNYDCQFVYNVMNDVYKLLHVNVYALDTICWKIYKSTFQQWIPPYNIRVEQVGGNKTRKAKGFYKKYLKNFYQRQRYLLSR